MHPQQHLIFQEFTESLPGHFPVGPMQGGCSMVTQNEVGGRECMQRWGAERALPYSCVTVPGPGHKHLLLVYHKHLRQAGHCSPIPSADRSFLAIGSPRHPSLHCPAGISPASNNALP